MFTEYLNILNKISPLSFESELLLLDYLSIKKIKKGDYILAHNKICKHIYFVNEGFVRIFYYKNGKDITEWFSNKNQFFFSITSYFDELPSNLIIEASEDSEIIFLSKKGLGRLMKSNLEIANLFIELLSGSLIFSQKRIESIQFETAKQRYFNLIKVQPTILNKMSLQHISSFLGITQETLSRIRSNI